MSKDEVRTRFAPSPTGTLHTGGARTALFNWLFARSSGGKFILRIDDTDTLRSEKRFEESIISDLEWLGLKWDEGPDVAGECGPYRQSERTGIYKEIIAELLDKGFAYKCYCTRVRLAELREALLSVGRPPRYDRRCHGISLSDAPVGRAPVVRFKVPEGSIVFTDAVRGEVVFQGSEISDFIIESSDGSQTYNFASAIDDSLMRITHVIRGDDHLSNTPGQIMILKALGRTLPVYAHLPLIVAPGGRPLSKREMSAALGTLREAGFRPEAVINALSRLGWAPGEEGLLSLTQMTELFDLKKLSKSPSVFDTERLGAFNRAAISKAQAEDFLTQVKEAFPSKDEGWLLRAISVVKADAVSISNLIDMIEPLADAINTDSEALDYLATIDEALGDPVKALLSEIAGKGEITEESAKAAIKAVKGETGLKGKQLFMPLRVALTGVITGVELYRVLELLGRDEAIKRLSAALSSAGLK